MDTRPKTVSTNTFFIGLQREQIKSEEKKKPAVFSAPSCVETIDGTKTEK